MIPWNRTASDSSLSSAESATGRKTGRSRRPGPATRPAAAAGAASASRSPLRCRAGSITRLLGTKLSGSAAFAVAGSRGMDGPRSCHGDRAYDMYRNRPMARGSDRERYGFTNRAMARLGQTSWGHEPPVAVVSERGRRPCSGSRGGRPRRKVRRRPEPAHRPSPRKT